MRRYCEELGRDPATIEVSEQILVVLGRNEVEVRREKERAQRSLGEFARFDGDVHVGTPAEVAAALRQRIDLGVEAFMVMFGDFGSAEQIELFSSEVLPALAPST